jgi:hypothetical protein
MSPARTVEAVATEKNFKPAWTSSDVLPRVIEAPSLDEAYSNTVRVDGAELNATNR